MITVNIFLLYLKRNEGRFPNLDSSLRFCFPIYTQLNHFITHESLIHVSTEVQCLPQGPKKPFTICVGLSSQRNGKKLVVLFINQLFY